MAEARRRFDLEFREGAVRIVRDTGKPIALVARDLGMGLTPDGGHLTGGTAGPAGGMSACRASVASTPQSFGSRLPAWSLRPAVRWLMWQPRLVSENKCS